VIFPQRRFVAAHPAVSGTARVRKQDGRRGRYEILAEKLRVPGQEGREY